MIENVFPASVVCIDGMIDKIQGGLYPEEFFFIENAVEKRRKEFTSGRLLAKEALRQLGIVDFPVVPANDRSPVWPEGIVGSISHTEDYCGVAVARRKQLFGIGFDAERIDRFNPSLWNIVCRESELNYISSLDKELRPIFASVIFSAKESFYKSQRHHEMKIINFRDVEIAIDQTNSHFTIHFHNNRYSPFCSQMKMSGKYCIQNGLVLTGITIT